ncbi:BURP domain-containing protein 3-like [Typha angustifolia]|uniref:BURP domain-containing protein 3-like n=1 Tax=Typha angustifolia TaxID=59011 RepID=UPI003C3071DD
MILIDGGIVYKSHINHLFYDTYEDPRDVTTSGGNLMLKSYIFLTELLQPGRNFNLWFSEQMHQKYPVLLPREVADSLPFSTAELPKILALFAVDPSSDAAYEIKRTLHRCEMPPIKGEIKHCATSLESMIDFVTSTLGTHDVSAVTTTTPSSKEGATVGQYTITAVQEIDGPNHVSCHLGTYAHALFQCHKLDGTKAYKVAVVEKEGTKSEMVAICHADTAAWSPTHIFFQVTKVKPGTVPICHFIPKEHILWSPNKQNYMSSS